MTGRRDTPQLTPSPVIDLHTLDGTTPINTIITVKETKCTIQQFKYCAPGISNFTEDTARDLLDRAINYLTEFFIAALTTRHFI